MYILGNNCFYIFHLRSTMHSERALDAKAQFFCRMQKLLLFREVGRSRLSEGELFPTNKSYSSPSMTYMGHMVICNTVKQALSQSCQTEKSVFFFFLLVFNQIPFRSISLWNFAGFRLHWCTWWLDLMSDGILIRTVTECTKRKLSANWQSKVFCSIWINMCDCLENQSDVTVREITSAQNNHFAHAIHTFDT